MHVENLGVTGYYTNCKKRPSICLFGSKIFFGGKLESPIGNQTFFLIYFGELGIIHLMKLINTEVIITSKILITPDLSMIKATTKIIYHIKVKKAVE